jgi:cytochrome c553
LSGQPASYLALQLQLFARGGRGGTRHAHLMERAAAGLQAGDIRDLSAYYASLPPPDGQAIIGR